MKKYLLLLVVAFSLHSNATADYTISILNSKNMAADNAGMLTKSFTINCDINSSSVIEASNNNLSISGAYGVYGDRSCSIGLSEFDYSKQIPVCTCSPVDTISSSGNNRSCQFYIDTNNKTIYLRTTLNDTNGYNNVNVTCTGPAKQ